MTLAHPLLDRAFRALDLAGIRWLVLRGEDRLAEPDGDVDLLVDPAAFGAAVVALRSAAFVPIPTAGRGSHRFFLGYGPEDDRWIKLDVVTDLAYGPGPDLATDLAPEVLDRRRTDGTVPVPAPDDAFWTLLLHVFLDKETPSPERWEDLRRLSGGVREDSPWARVVAPLARGRADSPAAIAAIVSARDARAAGELVRAMRARALGGPRRRASRVLQGVHRALERPKGFASRPGLAVALLGQDGSGKSTICAAIAASVPFPARTVYMGLWRQPAARRQILPGSDLAFRLSLAWRAYLVGLFHRLLRRLVIFDRYTYDALLGAGERLGPKDRAYLTILARSCPAPDLVIVLDTPSALAHARKPEHDITALERDRLRFLALAGTIPGADLVDASRPLPEVKTEVVGLIWRAYVARWAR